MLLKNLQNAHLLFIAGFFFLVGTFGSADLVEAQTLNRKMKKIRTANQTQVKNENLKVSSTPQSRNQVNHLNEQKSRFQAEWKISLAGERQQDALANQRLQTGLTGVVKSEYALTDFLNLKIQPRAYFKNGNIQTNSASEGKSSSLEMGEASANLHYQESAELSLGALNQQSTSSPILAEDLAFPSIRAKLQYGETKKNSAALFAQYAVPTSATLTTNSQDFEKTPSFAAFGFLGGGRAGPLSLQSSLQYFEYKDLPSAVATASGVLGNTTTSQSTSSLSNFLYSYRGYDGTLLTKVALTRKMSLGLQGFYTQNIAAPQLSSQGSSFKGFADLWLGPTMISPYYEYFRIAPDAAVAFYNSSLYETNRVGYSAGLSLRYKKIFSVTAGGGVRDAMFESATQPRENFYTLKLETLYAPF